MPITVFDDSPEEKKELIEKLSSEIDFLYNKIKEMKSEDELIKSGIELLQKHNCDFEDESRVLRQIFVFIAMLAIENNTTIKNLLLSKSEVDDLLLIKNGITTLQEGCKKLIGFYLISKKNSFVNDVMVRDSLLYQIHNKFKGDNLHFYSEFEKHINNFTGQPHQNNFPFIFLINRIRIFVA